jgi:hypothetical protein
MTAGCVYHPSWALAALVESLPERLDLLWIAQIHDLRLEAALGC